MNVLVDTNALIWWLLEPRHLSIIGHSAIEQADEVFVSAVSIYEVDYKREKLRSSGHLANSTSPASRETCRGRCHSLA